MEQPVAIVTGAGRGIGRASALALASEGYRVALVARTESELLETQAGCAHSMIFPIDVSNSAQVSEMVARTAKESGRLDAIVHCAGVAPVVSVEQTSDQQWHQTIDTNLSGAFYLARAAWPIFRQQHGGVIVNISSLSARDPFPGFAAYGAAKAGLNLLGLALAREGQSIGVRVHTLALGAVETAMFRAIRTPEQFSPEQTLKPDEVAGTVVQCVRGDLRHTSGEVITLRKTL
jgi:NAD(P)-dependent dehydrogenase (short-subunit alcohol dehydrogenase family)